MPVLQFFGLRAKMYGQVADGIVQYRRVFLGRNIHGCRFERRLVHGIYNFTFDLYGVL